MCEILFPLILILYLDDEMPKVIIVIIKKFKIKRYFYLYDRLLPLILILYLDDEIPKVVIIILKMFNIKRYLYM